MRKSSLLRVLVVVGLSILLIANLNSVAFADDNDFSDWDNPTVVNTTTDDNSNTNSTVVDNTTNEVISENTSNATNNASISTGSATTTLNTSTDNTDEENEVNSLAYTGLEDTSILAVIMVLGVIVAGYSFKKVRDYNNV